MRIKKLIGKKCSLSPIDVNDYVHYAEWLNNEEVSRYLTVASKVISLEAEKEMLAELAKTHTYGIIENKTEKLIGNISLMNIDNVQQTAELGIFIGEQSCWNKGYGTEAVSLLIDYGFRVLNLHNIMLRVYAYNERALTCYEKIGFKKIGERRSCICYDRKRYNEILMDILAQDFYG